MRRIIDFIKEHERIIRFIGVFLAIAVLAVVLQPIVLKIIKSNPDLSTTYNFITMQLNKMSILWLFIVVLVGTFFFIALPNDFLFLFYILRGADPFLTTLACFFGIFFGRMFNFWFGSLFRDYAKKHVFKKKFKSFHEKFHKHGGAWLFWGNFIPFFPMEQFNTFVGTTHYGFRKYLLYQSLGKLSKLILLYIGIHLLMERELIASTDLF